MVPPAGGRAARSGPTAGELAAKSDWVEALSAAPYCGHDGVPCGGEDVGVVVALVVPLQLLGEVLSGQLEAD